LLLSKTESRPGITVPEFVLAGAEAYADKVALAEAAPGGLSYTYGEVDVAWCPSV
jgi:hypothetical protein